MGCIYLSNRLSLNRKEQGEEYEMKMRQCRRRDDGPLLTKSKDLVHSAGVSFESTWALNDLRRTASFLAWQVQHLERLGAACGQPPPWDRMPSCVAGAALGALKAAFAWQLQLLERLGVACDQRRRWDRAPF